MSEQTTYVVPDETPQKAAGSTLFAILFVPRPVGFRHMDK